MILFTVGTHEQPFDRLVAAAAIAARGGERVVVQRGTSRVDPPGCEVHDHLDRERFSELLASARIVVSHAGPSTLDRVLARGRLPIVVPRDPACGEHVDDHQLRYARWLADRLHVVPDPADLPDAIAAHPALEAQRRAIVAGLRLGWADGDARVAAAFAAVVDDLLRPGGGRSRGVRATLARLPGSPRR